MIPEVFKRFINKLTTHTEKGILSWSEGEFDSFVCDHKEYSLYIRRNFDEERDIEYISFRFMVGQKSTPFTILDRDADFAIMNHLFDAVVANANSVSSDIENFFD